MTSNDMRFLANDEQAFKVYVITKLEGMEQRLTNVESEQKELRAEQKELRADVKELRAEVKVLAKNQVAISAQVSNLQYNFNLWFPVLAVVIGVVGVFVPLFLNRKKDSSSAPDMSEYVKVSEFHSQLDREFKLRGL